MRTKVKSGESWLKQNHREFWYETQQFATDMKLSRTLPSAPKHFRIATACDNWTSSRHTGDLACHEGLVSKADIKKVTDLRAWRLIMLYPWNRPLVCNTSCHNSMTREKTYAWATSIWSSDLVHAWYVALQSLMILPGASMLPIRVPSNYQAEHPMDLLRAA